ncbi:MAG: hypothetical protein JJE44_02950 [Flavobacteriaceae bacterium]|nr:hypothetical protein [Flavobacteriaceae bacterium]
MTITFSKEHTKLILSSRNEAEQHAVNTCEHPENVNVLPLDLEDYINLPSKMIRKLAVT